MSRHKPVMDAADYFAAERLRWKEEPFQVEVLRLAHDNGWTHRYHTYRSDRSASGFPDLVLVRPRTNQVIFAELKSMRGKLSPSQEDWIAALRECALVYVWMPCCWNSGELQAALR